MVICTRPPLRNIKIKRNSEVRAFAEAISANRAKRAENEAVQAHKAAASLKASGTGVGRSAATRKFTILRTESTITHNAYELEPGVARGLRDKAFNDLNRARELQKKANKLRAKHGWGPLVSKKG